MKMTENEKKIIAAYHGELLENYQNAKKEYGSRSEVTKNYFAKWAAVDALLDLLKGADAK